MKLKDVHYARTFAGNNDKPREHIGQYENERIGVTIEATDDTEGPELVLEQAIETVHKLQEQATQFRVQQREVQRLKNELELIEEEIEEAKDVTELNARAQDIKETLRELGAVR